ncbi:hypothetical protein SDC9_19957 [bioreactor metagenome]|uniref:Uncharacterized protein n=1 Tax=bioreactor metagenome TaxID=1076179 RepID=A0A644U5F5_9ZZZZ
MSGRWRRGASAGLFRLVTQAHLRQHLVALGLALFGQRLFDEFHVPGHRRPGRRPVARLDRGVDRAVLLQQRVARGAIAEHDLAVVEHAFLQQLEHRAHHVQGDDIVSGLDDRHVELRIERGLVRRVALCMGGFHALEEGVDHPQVGIRGKPRGPLGRQPLEVAPEREIVEHRLLVAREQPDQRRREGRAEHVGNEDARPRAGGQKAFFLQLGHCLAQRGARNGQALGQFALGGQPFAGPQDALQDQPFDLAHDGRGELFGFNFLERHFFPPLVKMYDHIRGRAMGNAAKRPGRRPRPLVALSCRSVVRTDDELDAAVLRAALDAEVRGDRLILAAAIGDEAGARHAGADQDLRDGIGALLRQTLVVVRVAGVVGVAHHLDRGVGIAVQAARKGVEIALQIATHHRAVRGEEHVLWHGDDELRAGVDHRDAVGVEVAAQFLRLLVKLVADRAADQPADHRAGRGLRQLVVAAPGRAEDAADQRAGDRTRVAFGIGVGRGVIARAVGVGAGGQADQAGRRDEEGDVLLHVRALAWECALEASHPFYAIPRDLFHPICAGGGSLPITSGRGTAAPGRCRPRAVPPRAPASRA